MTLSIAGKHIYLRPLTIEDASSYHLWVSDPEVIRYSLSKWQKQHTLEAVGSWVNEIINSSTSINFAIVGKRTNAVIGHAGIAGISEANRSGEYFILIGDKSYWNRGIGTEATRLVVGYGFTELGLHRIMLTVSDLNIGGLRAYTKVGFKEEGVLRDAALRDGRFHNKIILSMLESEWHTWTDTARKGPHDGR